MRRYAEGKPRAVAWLLCVLLVYWATRLWQLLSLPIFSDEGVYIWRSLQLRAGDWRVGFDDGNALQVWLLAVWLPLTAHAGDALLWSARWLNVAFGSLALVFLCATAQRAFSTRAAVWAALFYLSNPFALFYNRMALADGLLLLCYACALWLALRLQRQKQLRDALALGVAITLACLTKLSGLVFLCAPVVVVCATSDWTNWKERCYYAGWAAGVVLLVMLPLSLAGWGQAQAGKFVANLESDPAAQLSTLIVAQVANNLLALTEWLASYLPGALGLVVCVTCAAAIRLGRSGWLWLGGVLIPLLFFVLTAFVWFPRYVLFTFIPIAVLMGWWLDAVSSWLAQRGYRWAFLMWALLLLWIIGPSLQFDVLIVTDPVHAPWTAVERWQYVEGWPSGYGIAQTAAFLREAASQSERGIHVMRHQLDSPTREALEIYLRDDANITLHSMDLRQDDTRKQLINLKQQRPTYVVLTPPREEFDFVELYPRKIKRAEFAKPTQQFVIQIFEW